MHHRCGRGRRAGRRPPASAGERRGRCRSTRAFWSPRAAATAPAIERTLRDGARVNARNRLGETALRASRSSRTASTSRKCSLAAGADVNLAAVNGITPLMAAPRTAATPDMVEMLLDKGADGRRDRPAARRTR